MPNLLAHHLLVKRFALKEEELRNANPSAVNFIEGNFDYLALGAQGPDPMFYHGIVPGHALHLVAASHKTGNKLHKEDGKRFFRLLVERAYGVNPDERASTLPQSQFQAFVFGQFSHYLLDRECHPYILYESGFDPECGKIKGRSHYDQAHFESEIDYCICKKYKNDYFLSHPSDILVTDKKTLENIDLNLVPVLEKMYGYHLPKHFYSNSVRNMKSMVSYLNNGSDFRANMFPKNMALGAMRFPKDVKEDVLNEKRDVWLDPVTGEKHMESFLELHSKAFRILEDVYVEILRNGFNYESFAKYINGLNYYGTPVDSKWVYQKKR